MTQTTAAHTFSAPHFFRLQAAFLAPLGLMLVLVLANANFSERAVADFFAAYRAENLLLSRWMRWVSDWGNFCMLALYLLFLAKSLILRNTHGLRFILSFIVVQYGLVLLLTHALKLSVGAPRPYTLETIHQPFVFNSDYHSFPSGHTYEAAGLAGPLAQGLHRATVSFLRSIGSAVLWGLVPALMGFSRMYLGKHFALDVAGGALLASLATFLIAKCMAWEALWQRLPCRLLKK